MSRYFSATFGGSVKDHFHDGTMKASYLSVFSQVDANTAYESTLNYKGGEVSNYADIFPAFKNVETDDKKLSPIVLNFSTSAQFATDYAQGVCSLNGILGDSHYSVYRREYEVYQRPGDTIKGYYKDGWFYSDKSCTESIKTLNTRLYYIDITTGYWYSYNGMSYSDYLKNRQPGFEAIEEFARVYKGDWEPVIVNQAFEQIYDFNISADRTYQYIIYPINSADTDDNSIGTATQTFANFEDIVWKEDENFQGKGKFEAGSLAESHKYGAPLNTCWDYWSIAELEPMEFEDDSPIVKNAYSINVNQMWFFKYGLEIGAQAQNITRNEVTTLGQFVKIGYGETNYASSEVTAYLGSEIIPYYKQDYIERLANARNTPLSTNEKTLMLQQWKKFVASKNPKLLRDTKGQVWIVQIMSSSTTTKVGYYQQPETITFSWKQIEDPSGVLIYNKDVELTYLSENKGSVEWTPAFRSRKNF